MKNIRHFTIFGVLFLALIIVVSSCKKKSEDTEPAAPTFVMSSTIDPDDVTKVFFYFKCTTNDVKLTKLVVKDPLGAINDVYDLQSMTFLKDQIYQLTTSYTKESGTWKFEFTGNRTSDNTGFVSNTTLVL